MQNKDIRIQVIIREQAFPELYELLNKINDRGARPKRFLSLALQGLYLEKLSNLEQLRGNHEFNNTKSSEDIILDITDESNDDEKLLGI